jgi:proprotein convertase subtilisin/kexin type 5
MCWSICPGGYYANNTDNACHLCPPSINCGNCTYSSSSNSVVCTTCAYGYYYQASSTSCLSGCNATQYPNKANNTCSPCDAGCLGCTGPSASMCTSCDPALLLVQNVTGGYCVGSCQTVGYTQSGTNCLACDSSCYTCSGTANN